MKKVSVILSMLVLATTASIAQGKVQLQDFHVKLNDGANTIRVPNNGGTIQLVKRGDKFSEVVYTDAAGTSSRLSPVRPGSNVAPQPACKYPIPDACYAIPNNQKIGMCICRPTDIKSNDDFTVTLLLPAVQKVREAANR
ncbi:hypothetical protein [Paraflavitalea sp. CAU 1676]|uniref:hypothetical protein n=1 Tax=Paraflavitalea sp. CAU 1676 TaxID=3032598 RepID=UPI0023DC5DCD|nr:hypothetical protein [Paraflavitalea sp. CAU 1676]MDF2190378.1 hypothetical protein [Paraflavitalea sp. CAU 1676]